MSFRWLKAWYEMFDRNDIFCNYFILYGTNVHSIKCSFICVIAWFRFNIIWKKNCISNEYFFNILQVRSVILLKYSFRRHVMLKVFFIIFFLCCCCFFFIPYRILLTYVLLFFLEKYVNLYVFFLRYSVSEKEIRQWWVNNILCFSRRLRKLWNRFICW